MEDQCFVNAACVVLTCGASPGARGLLIAWVMMPLGSGSRLSLVRSVQDLAVGVGSSLAHPYVFVLLICADKVADCLGTGPSHVWGSAVVGWLARSAKQK